MKKSLVLGILGVAAAATSYGQGTVNFFNYFSSASPRISYAASNVPGGKANLAIGGTFSAELGWFNGTSPANLGALTLLPGTLTYFSFNGPAANGTADGDIYDAAHPAGNGAGWFLGPGVSLTGAAAGTTVTLDVFTSNGGAVSSLSGNSIGWSGTTTVAGSSGLFTVSLGGGALPPASLNGAMPNFTVANVVPEPSMFALAGLGAAGLMALRRKKA